MRPTLRERLLSGATIDWETGCWNWSRSTFNSKGGPYGKICREGRAIGTHVAAYELLVGPVPEGRELDHLCRNTLCLNPAHLAPKTHRQNVLCGTSPAAVNARKTHCEHGHEFDLLNTHWLRDGRRSCRACDRDRHRAWRRKRRARPEPIAAAA